jgi:hypothetical protein
MGKVSNQRSDNTRLIMRRCRMGAKLLRLGSKWKIGWENSGLSSPLEAERRESSLSVVVHHFGAIGNIGARPFVGRPRSLGGKHARLPRAYEVSYAGVPSRRLDPRRPNEHPVAQRPADPPATAALGLCRRRAPSSCIARGDDVARSPARAGVSSFC